MQINLSQARAQEMGRGRHAARSSKLIVLANLCAIFIDLSQAAAATAPLTLTQGNQVEQRQQQEQQHRHQHHQRQRQQARSARLLAATGQASEQTSALAYLQKYGYMQAPANGAQATHNLVVTEESFSSAVADFQRFVGLPETGLVDNKTLELMRLPRCGNSDKWRPGGSPDEPDGQAGAVISKSGQLVRRLELAPPSAAGGVRRRRKRYALQGSKWRRQELTYRISQYPSRFSGKRHEVDHQIDKAFSIWSQVAPIDFVVKKEGRVHIDIRFASGEHGDGDAFDGPGNTLAHAYFPQYGGDAHFDDQEYWTIDSYAGTNIFQVAAHELGHSLGLGHSNVREALMAPFYQKYKPHFKLHLDDVLAIQALYGEKPGPAHDFAGRPNAVAPGEPSIAPITPTAATTTTTQPPPPTTTTSGATTSSTLRPNIYKGARKPPSAGPATGILPGPFDEPGDERDNGIPNAGPELGEPTAGPGSSHLGPAAFPADLCSEPAIDAITRTEDGATYVFKGAFYWLLLNEGLAKGYPRRIALDWEGLPDHLDAALTWADGKTFFFKGNKYWRFRNRRPDIGYPKLISAGFAGIPDDLDAALVWSGNGRTYFFKGAEYWRFDSKADPPVSAEYPRSVKVWLGVPAHLNAAFKWENNVTYFFKGNRYYRFNDKEFRVEARGRPPFPRPTAEWWFGCPNSNLAQRALSGSLRHQQHQLTSGGAAATDPIAATPGGELAPLGRVATAQQRGRPGPGAGDDWSLLADLGDSAPRPLGTHISDHQQGSVPGSTGEVESTGGGGGSGLDAELAPDGEARASAADWWPPPLAVSKRWGSPPFDGQPGASWLGTAHKSSSPSSSSSSSSSAILNSAHHQLVIGLLTWALCLALSLNHHRPHLTSGVGRHEPALFAAP